MLPLQIFPTHVPIKANFPEGLIFSLQFSTHLEEIKSQVSITVNIQYISKVFPISKLRQDSLEFSETANSALVHTGYKFNPKNKRPLNISFMISGIGDGILSLVKYCCPTSVNRKINKILFQIKSWKLQIIKGNFLI